MSDEAVPPPPKNVNDEFGQFFSKQEEVPAADALAKCQNFLGGSWIGLKEEDFAISSVQNGLSNRLYLCENKSTAAANDSKVPNKVLVRYYGGKLLEKDHIFRNGGEAEEVLVFFTMSKLGLGPKLHGVFEGGRVEEFLNCHVVTNEDILNPEMMTAFARKLARMHSLKLPFNKNNPTVFDKAELMMPQYIAEDRDEIAEIPIDPSMEHIKQAAISFDIEKEFAWLKDHFLKIKTRIVLCHGDMNRANCLVRDDKEDPIDRLVLVDYEFSSYAYREQDIGGQFSNRRVDVRNPGNKFKSGLDYPSEEERLHFIRSYKDEIKLLNSYELDESDEGLDNDENMLMASEYFVLATTIMFILMILTGRKKTDGLAASVSNKFSIFFMMADFHERYMERKKCLMERFAHKLK